MIIILYLVTFQLLCSNGELILMFRTFPYAYVCLTMDIIIQNIKVLSVA